MPWLSRHARQCLCLLQGAGLSVDMVSGLGHSPTGMHAPALYAKSGCTSEASRCFAS